MIRTVVAGLCVSTLVFSCAGPRMGARYFVAMDDASGLGAAAPVYVSGVRVGTVQMVKLDGARARIDFDIESASGVVLREDACATAGWYSGAVTPHLKLEIGTDAARALGNGGEIKCVKTSGTSTDVEKAAASMRKLLESAVDGKGTIGRLFKDEELAQRIADYFAKTPAPAPKDPLAADPKAPAPAVEPKTKPLVPKPAPKSDVLDPFSSGRR